MTGKAMGNPLIKTNHAKYLLVLTIELSYNHLTDVQMIVNQGTTSHHIEAV